MKKMNIGVSIFLLIVVFYLVYRLVNQYILVEKPVVIPNPNSEVSFQIAPEINLQDINGKNLTLSQFADKKVIVHFWASWCPPCVQEFPGLVKFINSQKGKIELLALSSDYNEREMIYFIKKYKLESPYLHVAWDRDHHYADLYGTRRLPESYILNPGLKFYKKIPGSINWLEFSDLKPEEKVESKSDIK